MIPAHHSHETTFHSLPGTIAENFCIQEVNGQYYLIPKGCCIVDNETLNAQQASIGCSSVLTKQTICNWQYFIPEGTSIPDTEEYTDFLLMQKKSSGGRKTLRESTLSDTLSAYCDSDSLPKFSVPANTFIPAIPFEHQKIQGASTAAQDDTGHGHTHAHTGCDCGPGVYDVYRSGNKYTFAQRNPAATQEKSPNSVARPCPSTLDAEISKFSL